MRVDIGFGSRYPLVAQARLQFADAPGAVAHLTGKDLHQPHDVAQALMRQPGREVVGLPQLPRLQIHPFQAFPQCGETLLRRRLTQYLAAGYRRHMLFLRLDRHGHVVKAGVADIKGWLSRGGGFGVLPPVAVLTAPPSLGRPPDDPADRIAFVTRHAYAGQPDIRRVQHHGQPGQPLEDHCELRKLLRIAQMLEKQGARSASREAVGNPGPMIVPALLHKPTI
ncbi:MAG: hypothetical protein WCP55_07185 [Lentisphaerota bacterium]